MSRLASWRAYWRHTVGLGMLLCGSLACAAGPLPSAGDAPTPCIATCPPPQRSASTPHTVSLSRFRLTYFDPWSVDSSDNHSVILVAQTQLGQIDVEVASTSVTAGTTAAQLVSRAAQQLLSPDEFSGVQDAGPILGAEIGYVSGAGESYTATSTAPNAPATPVYLEVMSSVRGTTGLTFAALSPLDPSARDAASGVPNQVYDQLVNSVEWTS